MDIPESDVGGSKSSAFFLPKRLAIRNLIPAKAIPHQAVDSIAPAVTEQPLM
jgi:hypothetical protein